MAAIFGTESFEGGTNGAALTAANTQFTSVQAGWTFTDTPAPPVGLGSLRAQVQVAAGQTSYLQAPLPPGPIAVPRVYVRFPSVPTTGSVDLSTLRAGTSLRARFGIVDGKFVLRNGSTIVWTSTVNVPATREVRYEWRTDNTLGEQQIRLFLGANHHGTSPDETSPAVTLTPGAEIDMLRVGPANNTLTVAWTAFYDAVVVSDVTWPGPGYTQGSGGGGGTTPTVSAGADQLGVEPWSTVTLSATSTGTLTGLSWTQLAGSPVALAGAGTASVSFEAPAFLQGASLQFQVEGSYASGSVTDFVNVTVRAVTERAVIGGREVPMRVMNVFDAGVATGGLGTGPLGTFPLGH